MLLIKYNFLQILFIYSVSLPMLFARSLLLYIHYTFTQSRIF